MHSIARKKMGVWSLGRRTTWKFRVSKGAPKGWGFFNQRYEFWGCCGTVNSDWGTVTMLNLCRKEGRKNKKKSRLHT